MRTQPATDLTDTRDSWHRVAEHLLAAARKRATGQITLLPHPGGFATPELPDGRVLAVVGTELVVIAAEGERRAPLTTLAELADVAGVEAGFPWTKHPPATAFEPDRRLTVDARAAAELAEWFALGDTALTALRQELPGASTPQIFPEHFDLGITADEVNYGFSPGDTELPEPYAYIGPHDLTRASGSFWNAPFGASRTRSTLPGPEQALAFFRSGVTALAL